MKKQTKNKISIKLNRAIVYLLFIACSVMPSYLFAQGAAINTTGANADPSAMLDVSSNTKGILITRMTTSDRNAIASPAEGLQIFNTTTKCFEFFAYGIWQTGNCAISPPFLCGTSNISFIYRNATVTYGTIVGQNGTCWMDRNLGASQKATVYNDAQAYGDLFEWGRGDDGHQLRTSNTTSTLSSNDQPGHADFITTSDWPYDWRIPQNDNLWQGVNGINNPCPTGWCAPTSNELDNERASWSSQNHNGAFASNLKWVTAGYRANGGTFEDAGTIGYYWSSTLSGTNAIPFYFYGGGAGLGNYWRANGCSVRCIKN